MGTLPRVSEYMDTEVYSLRPETEILTAVDFLLEHRRTGAPVVDEANKLVGMLSEKDCLNLLAVGADNNLPKGTVADFMSAEVITVPPHMNVYFAAGMFLNAVVRRFPVVENGVLVGVITRLDILRAIQKYLRPATP